MGTQRTSNKDIADKLDTLISILTAQAQAPVVETEPAVTPLGRVEPKQADTPAVKGHPEVPRPYWARMDSKITALTAADGQERVAYLRHNLKGETKIAYCLRARWDTLKDNGLIGAVKIYK
jgi:hypothetical protein